MIITATDFQLSVNEYFTKLMQGEEIIIERYGKKFAVLVPYDTYEKSQDLHSDKDEQQVATKKIEVGVSNSQTASSKLAGEKLLTPEELTKLIKLLLA
jgi:PHD/YefM family antitoxin component YafN of YafNO toxin-antitoxin module